MDVLERKRVRDEVKACKACGLRERCIAPVPFSGPSDPQLVVVGEAPGIQEDEAGAPFVGPSGALVRSWLQAAEWDIDKDVAFVNAVSCFPRRTPTKDEVNACQTNIHKQLAHLDCRRLLVLGGIAVQALRKQEIRIGEIRGLWWRVDRVTLDSTWALATWHPAAVLRNQRLGFEAFDDVDYMTAMIKRKLEPTLGSFCVKCGAPGVDFYVDIPYCERHLPKG